MIINNVNDVIGCLLTFLMVLQNSFHELIMNE